MSLCIRQEEKYVGHDRWKWSVWLEGPQAELDQIDHVMYILHPTFHNPVREIPDRSSNFRLEASSWGTFTIRAKAIFKDGTEQPLQHDLQLHYPDGTPTPA
jgi:transcription initiation factor IIF auxiliary subunit